MYVYQPSLSIALYILVQKNLEILTQVNFTQVNSVGNNLERLFNKTKYKFKIQQNNAVFTFQ